MQEGALLAQAVTADPSMALECLSQFCASGGNGRTVRNGSRSVWWKRRREWRSSPTCRPWRPWPRKIPGAAGPFPRHSAKSRSPAGGHPAHGLLLRRAAPAWGPTRRFGAAPQPVGSKQAAVFLPGPAIFPASACPLGTGRPGSRRCRSRSPGIGAPGNAGPIFSPPPPPVKGADFEFADTTP